MNRVHMIHEQRVTSGPIPESSHGLWFELNRVLEMIRR